MCGIGILVCNESTKDEEIEVTDSPFKGKLKDLASAPFDSKELAKEMQNSIKPRGPNAQNTIEKIVQKFKMTFSSSVLHLRGDSIGEQPQQDPDGNIFMWNGEVFGGKIDVQNNESDTIVLAKALYKSDSPMEILRDVEGPWAFAFWNQKQQRLWFGRSKIGQRSLLVHHPTVSCPYLSISSVPFGRCVDHFVNGVKSGNLR